MARPTSQRRAKSMRGIGQALRTRRIPLAIRFGAWHTDINIMDGPFGRVSWFNRALTDAELAVLAQPKTIVRT